LRKYGHCLAIDGQGAQAIQVLERARDLLQSSASRIPDSPHLLLDLGRAYESGGRIKEAREAFATAIATMESHHAPAFQMAAAREGWGRFLLSHGDINTAYSQFVEVLRLSPSHPTEPAVLAEASLAAIALSRGDVHTALQTSSAAIEHLAHLSGYYDIRVEPYVWGVHATALLMSGDMVNARAFASRSSEATAHYYDSGSTQVKDAAALLQRVAGNASLQQ